MPRPNAIEFLVGFLRFGALADRIASGVRRVAPTRHWRSGAASRTCGVLLPKKLTKKCRIVLMSSRCLAGAATGAGSARQHLLFPDRSTTNYALIIGQHHSTRALPRPTMSRTYGASMKAARNSAREDPGG